MGGVNGISNPRHYSLFRHVKRREGDPLASCYPPRNHTPDVNFHRQLLPTQKSGCVTTVARDVASK
jgi:hypothetical protein